MGKYGSKSFGTGGNFLSVLIEKEVKKYVPIESN